jgi:hypothetical protein
VSTGRAAKVEELLGRMPENLRPLDAERDDGGRRRRIQNGLLIAIAIVLAVSVGYDLTRQAKISYRLTADIETWREITGHDFKNVSIVQDTHHYTTTDIACGNTGDIRARAGHKPQICFVIVGPIIHETIDGRSVERRASYGGFFVPAFTSTDYKVNRYGCFGRAIAEERCKRSTPSGLPYRPPKDFAAEVRRLTG